MEFQLRGADGKLRWFLTRVRPVRDDEGRIVRWFGSNTNIDERRKNDDFKEMFLGIVGHDLRNPLHTILFTSRHLASRADMSEENRKMLQRVASSGARMKRMIEQLLDVTRARLAGGIPVELSTRPVALAPLVGKIVDEIRGGYAGLHVEMNIDPECSARVDEDRFEQVVSNLLGNAATHGEPGRPIDVTLASGDGWVSVAIHNDGKPIAPEFLPLLWNPFARNDKPHGRSAGLGLGLYICERIIDAHRGQLSVQSSAEAGTRFEIRLPKDTTTPAL
jgi:signal transduction histidine kinase